MSFPLLHSCSCSCSSERSSIFQVSTYLSLSLSAFFFLSFCFSLFRSARPHYDPASTYLKSSKNLERSKNFNRIISLARGKFSRMAVQVLYQVSRRRFSRVFGNSRCCSDLLIIWYNAMAKHLNAVVGR